MILELLEYISCSLNSINVPYMISGSTALNAYAVPRLTRDIDIVIELAPDRLNEFISIFNDRFYFVPEVIESEAQRKGMFNVIDHQTGYKIDFIVRKNSTYRQLEFTRRVKSYAFGFETWIVAIEDLILSKLEWIQVLQSEKQMDDIRSLVEIPGVDFDYIRKWCELLHLESFELIPHE